MIKVLGDSHALYCFRNMAGVFAWPLGPVTLKRVGYREDTIVQDNINRIGAAPDDLFLFLFGEIDVRAFVKPWYERRKEKNTLAGMLEDWVGRYTDAIAALDLNGAKIGLVSVPPPVYAKSVKRMKMRYPLAGTNAERAEYAATLNRVLFFAAIDRGWPFIDLFPLYADKNGMLPARRANSVHIKDNRAIRKLLVEMGLLQ